MRAFKIALAATALTVLLATPTRAQNQAPQSKADSVATEASKEMVFDAILIEGVVEKPNVTILRNRIQADFDEVGFVERSFSAELKRLPDKAGLFDESFESVGKIDNLKKLLEEMLRTD